MIKIYCIKKSKKFSVVLAPSPFLSHLILFFFKKNTHHGITLPTLQMKQLKLWMNMMNMLST